jgi:hypothetical protein
MSDVLVVSDHAIIRYMERKLGLNLDDLRKEISDINLEAYAQLGDGNYPLQAHDARAVVKDGVIVTVY